MTRKETLLSLLCLLVVGVCAMMIQVGNTHLWDQDEGFYAATAAEMHARGDWVTPTFNGKLFAHKPPIMFWGMMVGYEMFGVSELGARFVSSLFGLGTVFLTYGIARRLFDAATGLFAGLAIGSCVMFAIVARSATADAHLTFFTVLALYLWVADYFRAPSSDRDKLLSCDLLLSPFAPRKNAETLLSRSERRYYSSARCLLESVRWQTWIATYAVMGLAVLTKGPIGFLFPMAVVGLFLLTEQHVAISTERTFLRRVLAWMKPYGPIQFAKTVWAMRPFTAVAMILIVSAPWYLLVQWRTNGAFLQEFIGVHHLGRMSQAMDNHSGPFYYYLVACLIGMYPWSAFAIPTALSWLQQSMVSQHAKAIRFVSCWVAVYLVIFSLASTKLPNYVLPAYPALAIIIGRYFAMWTQDIDSVSRVWLKTGWILLIAFGGLIALGVPGLGLIQWNGETLLDRVGMDQVLQKRFVWLGVAGIPLLLFGTIGAWLLWSNRPRLSAGAFAVAASSLIMLLSQYVAPELDRFQSAQRLAQRWSTRVGSVDTHVAVFGFFRPTLVFYFARDIDFCDSVDEAIDFAKMGGDSILVTTESQYARLKGQLPDSTRIIERISQFPNRGEVLVLGDKSLMR